MIYLAAIPRCGSTYLFRAIAGLPQGSSTPEHHEHYGIVKTHRPPRAEPRIDWSHGDKALFLFGDVATAVVSTVEHRLDPQHFANCGAEWPPKAHLFDEDVLGYERIFDAWSDPPFPTLRIRYRAIGQPYGRSAIEGWLDRGVKWLPWRKRTTAPTDYQRERIEDTYDSLVAKVEEAPDIAVVGM